MDDAALMFRVQAGDTDAFGALYDRLSPRAYRVAYGVARDHPRAEQIIQEAFLSVWRDREQYRPEQGSVVDWVMGTVQRGAIRDALARLPATERDVIALAYFGELSASEIAQQLSLPVGTVKGRMRFGLDKLQGDA